MSPRLRNTLAAVLLAGTAAGGLASLPALAPHAQAAPTAALLSHPEGFADLVQQVSPAVVKIAVVGTERGGNVSMGEGSGFIIDPSGLVVTNFHVAGRAQRITVSLADGQQLPARVIGADQRSDLALLQVASSKPLPTVSFADGQAPRVGDVVLAMGNPFGLGPSVTSGIISAKGRDIGEGPYDSFLQTDASINPGNSGGPLFDLSGHVVGVNTAILSPSGASAGIGFAVPAEVASHVVEQLRAHGHVERGWIGVSAAGLEESGRHGALVAQVMADGPAARAGVRPGDVITAVDGQTVPDPRGLARIVADQAPGKDLELGVSRGPQALKLTVHLRQQPADLSRS